MSIDRLLAVLPPPAEPRETTGDWARVETEVGTALPQDFKDFIARYGTGVVNGFLWPKNPFAANKNLNLLREIRLQLEGLRGTKEQFPADFPFPLFPDQGGYLPWGTTDNGDVVHWRTQGTPDEWTVAVTAARDPEFEEHPVSMTDFLAQVLTRGIVCKIFPPKFPKGDPEFASKG